MLEIVEFLRAEPALETLVCRAIDRGEDASDCSARPRGMPMCSTVRIACARSGAFAWTCSTLMTSASGSVKEPSWGMATAGGALAFEK